MNLAHNLSGSVLLSIGITFAGNAAAQTKLDLATLFNTTVFQTENVAWFATKAQEYSKGKLNITVHQDGSLFKGTEIKRAVQSGQAHLGEVVLSSHANEDPLFGIDALPFLASGYTEGKRLWAMSREATQARFARQGLQALYAVPWPPQGLFSNKPINSLADMKGLKFRTYNPVSARIAELSGAQPVNIQATEVTQAMATGLVNVNITSSASAYDQRAWESMKYFYDLKLWLPKNIVFMNKKAFDRLDKETQSAVLRAAGEAEERGWKISEAKTNWYVEQLAARGMTVVTSPDVLLSEFRAIGDIIIKEWAEAAGDDARGLINELRK